MTEISTLGEFGLIDHLTADMKMQMSRLCLAWAMTVPC